MKENSILKFFSFFAGVVDTADKHSFANISANFRKKSKWSYWDTQGSETFIREYLREFSKWSYCDTQGSEEN
jgi:hypothetical protein